MATLLGSAALFDAPAHAVLARAVSRGDLPASVPFAAATAVLTGPVFYGVLTGHGTSAARTLAPALLAAVQDLARDPGE
ncbi:hypothetical protein JOF53_000773 [Crossiella equi]|uniref:Tetracyclin repressor-like C-terminal domain-containing protein n=1 Tax=Crossiella equi TaxID=130796 RepID=A0ABS5A5N3_9PSEU|nr:TetR/AcrR family transcriptional regulator C-terminal ligand-binding domain-containing protein [Crossiella equi]MBP2471901.1 hypothetical protein [Crossiella equi]